MEGSIGTNFEHIYINVYQFDSHRPNVAW